MTNLSLGYRNLSAIPKHEIVAQITSKLTEAEMADRLRTIASRDVTHDELRRTDFATLVKWTRAARLLTDDEVQQLNEEYRYCF